jgi:hypothetical protein
MSAYGQSVTNPRRAATVLALFTILFGAACGGGSGAPSIAAPSSTTPASSAGPKVSVAATGTPTSSGATTRPAGTSCGWTASPPAHYQHVIWLWFENKSASTVVGSSNAPYFNSLSRSCALATNFHNISHPSLPNYLGATSGTTNGLAADCSPASCSSNSRSLFRQLELAGKTWKGYDESMPKNCATTSTSTSTYATRHNPPLYFTDIHTTCPSYDVPLGSTTSGALASDLAHNTLPNFAFITPNLCNDMHDCSISTGDTWLKQWLTRIINSASYSNGSTAVFVTFDEGTGGSHGENCASSTNNDTSCQVATWVLGPAVHPGARVSTRFTHYSMLRTTEELLGLTTYLGNAATATSMRKPLGL